MDPKTLEQLKNKLLERKAEIEKELKQIIDGRSVDSTDPEAELSFPQYGDKEDENAAEVASYTDTLSLEHTLVGVLRDINSSLKRIEVGTYGVCKYCGKEIAVERLMARPDSSACMDCKTRISKQ